YVKEHATDIIRFKAQVLLKDVGDDPQRRTNAIESVVQSLAHIPDKVKRIVYIQECSRILGVGEEVIEGAVEKLRSNVVEQQRRQRQNSQIDSMDQAARNPQPDVSHQMRPSKSREMLEDYPFYPFERTVVYQCVRYGILDFCEVEFDDGTTDMINVAEYVADEIQTDEIWFTFPAFAKTFNQILDLKDDFANERVTFNVSLEKEKKKMLKAGYDEIAAKDMSMEEIRRAERLLEDSVGEEISKRRFEFARYFVEQKLSSHHDDDVRRTVTEAMNEEQPLSNIYLRNNPVSERKMEIDRMRVLVPRSVLEWKNELLNQRIKSKMKQLQSLDPVSQHEILLEIQALMEKRGQLGKVMGDRTIGTKFK
ncbi:MAG: hypothetical protein K2F93_09145, partial [Muribaculaceae bacterium]|nr:hypothetical protein [Muribaculaceae bacterium]